MNPGMQIRLEQDTVDKMKIAMGRFLPQYTHLDAHLPENLEYNFDWGLGALSWNFKWENITYLKPELDVSDI